MSKLDELIKEYCPDGVEYKFLWELTAWDKKFNAVSREKQSKVYDYHYLLANDLKELVVDGGDVKILTTSTTDLWTTEEIAEDYITDREVVAIPWGGNPNVQYYSGKFVTGDNRIATSLDTNILDNKFLYYYMQSKLDLIGSFYRGSGIKHPDMSKVLDLKIPLPALPVQREIVRVLDEFTLLSAELAAELAARKKQYEYYRNKVLSFDQETQIQELGEVCDFIRGPFGGSLKKECFVSSGYAVYEQQHAIYGTLDFRYFIDEKKFNELKRFSVNHDDLIISCSGTIGRVFIIPENAPKGIINQALLKLTPSKSLDSKYLKYFFENKLEAELNDVARGGAIKNVPSVAELKKIKIAVPPIKTQRRIADVLDNFDAICSDLNIGLPAEIEARQKQYEYYRDKLLDFKVKQ